jgi:hypothetical protein
LVGVGKLLDAGGCDRSFDGNFFTPLGRMPGGVFASTLKLYSLRLKLMDLQPPFTTTVVNGSDGGKGSFAPVPVNGGNAPIDRDRGTPRGATPPTPPGIRVTYHGGSTGLSRDRGMESGETERVEVVVAQGLLDRRVSGHAPEPCRRTGGDRCIELRYAATAQFVEAVVPVLPLPPKIRAQSSADPRFQVGEHPWGLAEAEVAAPSNEVWRQVFDQLR